MSTGLGMCIKQECCQQTCVCVCRCVVNRLVYVRNADMLSTDVCMCVCRRVVNRLVYVRNAGVLSTDVCMCVQMPGAGGTQRRVCQRVPGSVQASDCTRPLEGLPGCQRRAAASGHSHHRGKGLIYLVKGSLQLLNTQHLGIKSVRHRHEHRWEAGRVSDLCADTSLTVKVAFPKMQM